MDGRPEMADEKEKGPKPLLFPINFTGRKSVEHPD
jgi:hypothetical protein